MKYLIPCGTSRSREGYIRRMVTPLGPGESIILALADLNAPDLRRAADAVSTCVHAWLPGSFKTQALTTGVRVTRRVLQE